MGELLFKNSKLPNGEKKQEKKNITSWGEVLSRSLDIVEDAFRNGIQKKGSDMRVECGCIDGK